MRLWRIKKKSSIFLLFYRNYSFPIMDSYPITIFRKNILEYRDNIRTVIWNREYSHIRFDFERNSVVDEPFLTFFWGKFSKWFFYKFPSTCIFRFKYFLISYSCSDITTSSSWDENLISDTRILLKEMNMIIFQIWFEKCGSSHKSACSGSYNSYFFHNESINDFYEFPSIFLKSLFLSQRFDILV